MLPSMWMELYILIQAHKLSRAMENISKMIFVALCQIKCILNQSRGIKNLIKLAIEEETKIYSRPEVKVKKIYDGYVAYCKNIVLGLTYFTYFTGSSLILVNMYEAYEYFQTVPPELRNITVKPLSAPMWYPFDTNKHYFFPLVLQWFNVLQTVMYNSSIQALIHSVMIFIKAEFKILEYDLKNVGVSKLQKREGNFEDHNLVILKSLLRKHQQLIRWVKDFDSSIKYLLLLEYSVSSMLLASTLIQLLLRIKVLFNIPFLILCIIQIYVLGWNANEIIIESSTELCDSLYKCKWYEQSKEAKIIVHLMIIRSQRPLSLSIGPFGDMNLAAAISTTKLAYTFLSVFM
nr:odorant receptor 30 [Pachyrhinus yasumatsui]